MALTPSEEAGMLAASEMILVGIRSQAGDPSALTDLLALEAAVVQGPGDFGGETIAALVHLAAQAFRLVYVHTGSDPADTLNAIFDEARQSE